MNKTFVCIALLGSACAAAPDDELLGEMTQNGISLNGISLNGISLNGISLNGISLNGISLNGISLNGTTLSGTTLKANSTSGPPLSGSSAVGSKWTGTAANGTSLALRIDGASQGTGSNADLWFYAVSYQTSSGWSPLCGLDGAGKPVQAVTVAGVWSATASDLASYGPSTTQFTFACRAKTVAKCVELGYKTFKGYTNQMASCVRMLRGDYCGSGNAYTVDGTTLNVYDNVGVQTDTQVWAPEAEWTPSGARCVNKSNAARFELVLSKDPKCVRATETDACGTTFANGAILIDELSQEFQTQTQTTPGK
jgi:hypothetical protein